MKPDRAPARSRPLAGWRFDGTLRRYQSDILERVRPPSGEPLHIVAPPGSGKTLVGLLLAARDGRRAVALAPTTTIRHQWARTARELAAEAGAVSEDPGRVAHLTVLTYQALSVVRSDDAVGDLARVQWIQELVDAGRTPESAEAFLAQLERENHREYASGLRRRHRRLRRELVRSDPAQVAQVLHPNALDLVDRLVAAGVETVVLDECHHLLDHWALVIGYLLSRIREAGGEPHVIGLTATLPSPDDDAEYENYMGLLGEVDYELPTPAVVREGNLAPYRDLVWFTEPTREELRFLRTHEKRLSELVTETMGSAEGVDYLLGVLQPPLEDDGGTETSPSHRPAGARTGREIDRRLAAAFQEDLPLAESCARMLREVAPQHPLVRFLPPATRETPETEDALVVLGRFAQRRLLTDPAREEDWQRVRRTLADFGYQLTDRGIRRGRDPVDAVLAHSAAKDLAAVEILRQELAGPEGHEIRAVVICDFAVHGHQRGLSDQPPAGALRTFSTLVADPVTAGLRPVLLTGQHLRVATADARALLPELAARLRLPGAGGRGIGEDAAGLRAEPLEEDRAVSAVEAPGVSPSRLVAAVSALVTDRHVRLLVGTRGLLGEGWDCPAANTLVDLTAVATSSSTQQLRGRTLRLDPVWPGKVAHNWGVACLVPPRVRIDNGAEMRRVRRRHEHLWGLSADDGESIVSGLRHSLTSEQLVQVDRVVGKSWDASVEEVNAATLEALPPRSETRRRWRIGEPYVGAEREGVQIGAENERPPTFASTPTLAAVLALLGGALVTIGLLSLQTLAPAVAGGRLGGGTVALVVALWTAVYLVLGGWRHMRDLPRLLRRRARPPEVYRAVVMAAADTLHAMGRAPAFGASEVRVEPVTVATNAAGTMRTVGYDITLTGGSAEERRLVIDAAEEVFGPIERPRFLLRLPRTGTRPEHSSLAERLADRLVPPPRYVPVPRLIGRRREDAQRFTAAWRRHVGQAELLEVRGTDALDVLTAARRQSALPRGTTTHRTRAWY